MLRRIPYLRYALVVLALTAAPVWSQSEESNPVPEDEAVQNEGSESIENDLAADEREAVEINAADDSKPISDDVAAQDEESEGGESDLAADEHGPVESDAADAFTRKMMDGYESVRSRHLAEHLEIGVRVSHFTLDETKKQEFDEEGNFTGGFLGSIDRLDEEQDYFPTLYLRYNINPYAGLEIGWDKYEVKTGTYYDTSDGNFIYSGFNLLLRGRYPNETIFIPYGSIGWSFLDGEVDHNSEWHDDGRRNLYADDTVAFSYGLGCEIEIVEHWSADINFRLVKADFDVEYKLAAEPTSRGSFNFPLDNKTVQAGITYKF